MAERNPVLVKLLNDNGVPYPSYSVMWDLFRLSGLPVIDQSEVDLQSNTTFILPIANGNARAWGAAKRKCKLHCWQIERWLGSADDFAPDCFDQLWIADRFQAQALSDRPYVRYVPIGGHPDLCLPPSAEKKWDFGVVAYVYGRRQALLAGIASKGYSIAPNGFGEERNRILASCRAGLSIHQHDNDPSLNPLRATMMSCAKLPMVFEYVKDPHPFLTYGMNELDQAIRDERGYIEQNFKTITEDYEFRRVVEAACAA